MKIKGVVLWFDKRDGNGIIKGDDGSEFYTDVSVLKGLELKSGMRVAFAPNFDIPHCACARDVELV